MVRIIMFPCIEYDLKDTFLIEVAEKIFRNRK